MKLISWNVAGRVNKQPLQLEAVLKRKLDLLALQEVTSKTARMWREGLAQAEFEYILSTFDTFTNPEDLVGARRNGLLIASRWPLEQLEQKELVMPWMERLLSVRVNANGQDLELHNAYIPPGSSHDWLKIETFEGIYRYLSKTSDTLRILCGDFNSPKQEINDGRTVMWGQDLQETGEIVNNTPDRWQAGERSVILGLQEFDISDVYRTLKGWESEDYSWILLRKGKIVSQRRFDHIFASRDLNPIACQYIHEVRENGLSDHSAFEADFGILTD